MAAVSANRLELLQIADAVAREKSSDRNIVITATEDAIGKGARSRNVLCVEPVEPPSSQIALDEARRDNPAAQIGDTIADALPPLEYGRIAAQSAKQVIVQKGREAGRDRPYQEYKD